MTPFLRTWHIGLGIALALLTSALWAADYVRPPKGGEYNPKDQTVEMFTAMEKGDIAVKVIPKDSTQCRLLITNKTTQPLNVRLPDAFATVPVLAQWGGGGVGGGGGLTTGAGGQGGGGGGGGAERNIPPEKVGQVRVPTVCLEHGKAEPKPCMDYEIKPLEDLTTKPGVRELCELLGTRQINQRAAQAAAWHLNNDMSWEQLASKRLRFANGTSQPYFTQQEILDGMELAKGAARTAKQRQQEESTSSSTSAYADQSPSTAEN